MSANTSDSKTAETVARRSFAAPAGSACFDGTHRKAVDRTTANVFASGEQYEPRGKIACSHWTTPPRIRRTPPNAPQLAGHRFGRFEVIGLLADRHGAWVVRCACGDYETRSAKAIRNPNNWGDRCTKCRQTAFERKDYEFRKYGREIDQRTI